ncbi:sulfotransferase family protein [Phaeobacter marinintestinus]|uniref:sulfotransferase family protein n=1 Tax=Falsiphaeobacter marinintestinus TaxID=1492905 RepID=UPI0011B55939|nr:sulfotransferase [Phaeobacter marinintestinus]
MRRRLTVVLGVHRSGTSLLTNALVAMGADAGAFDDIHDDHNPDGYAEHPAIRNFNDRLLAHLGASWDNWGFRASTVDFDTPALSEWHDEATTLLQDAFPGSGPFVLKDPRIGTLAPFWERVIPAAGFDLRRILILRNPSEVAKSQRQRVERSPESFAAIADSEPMAALWAVTMFETLIALADDNTLMITHGDILTDPNPTLKAAADFAGLHPDPEAIAHFSRDGVKPALYRAHAGHDTTDPWMTAACALFDALRAPGTRHVLPANEARDIALSQTALKALLPGLPAVRQSIARLQNVRERNQARLVSMNTGLNRMFWILTPLAQYTPKAQLEAATEKALALAASSDLARHSFSFAHGVIRLLSYADRHADALTLLNSIRPEFGNIPAFAKLEDQLHRRPSD